MAVRQQEDFVLKGTAGRIEKMLLSDPQVVPVSIVYGEPIRIDCGKPLEWIRFWIAPTTKIGETDIRPLSDAHLELIGIGGHEGIQGVGVPAKGHSTAIHHVMVRGSRGSISQQIDVYMYKSIRDARKEYLASLVREPSATVEDVSVKPEVL
jgi:hypothetical protein